MWAIRSFALDDGGDVVGSWLAQHGADQFTSLRAKLDVRMLYLREVPNRGWKDPYFHLLKNQQGIGAVRFEWMKVAYRPLGFFGPNRLDFTFVYFATEKGDKYAPASCFDEAIRRMKLIKLDPSRAVRTRWMNA